MWIHLQIGIGIMDQDEINDWFRDMDLESGWKSELEIGIKT